MENKRENTMPHRFHRFQTIVIGSGAAGLNAAAALHKLGVKDVALLTEGLSWGTSVNTGSDKQTYYKMSTCGDDGDSVYEMARTIFDGHCADGDLAMVEAALSLRCFFHLVDIGVPFPHNACGEYAGYKTDHDPRKRGTSAGPLTSKFMAESLLQEVESRGITIFDGYQVIELLTENSKAEDSHGFPRIRGCVALCGPEKELEEQIHIFSADNIIYAVGGEAGLYQDSVYPHSQTGGLGPALRIGAKGKNLTESQYGLASVKFRWNLSGTYQQVIPRYISTDANGLKEEEFLEPYFENKEQMIQAIFLKGYQWPFDVRKLGRGGSSLIDLIVYYESVIRKRKIYLDYTRNPSCADCDGALDFSRLSPEAREYLENSGALLPAPIERLLHMNADAVALYKNHGIDLEHERLEIGLCAQHCNGGLSGNAWWESNISHLFPVGEANGSHGVYRPGGSALNAGQAGSLRAAEFISRCFTEEPWDADQLYSCCREQIESTLSLGFSGRLRQTAAEPEGSRIFRYASERKLIGCRTSLCAAAIRDLPLIQESLGDASAQLASLSHKVISKPEHIRHFYRIRDLLTSQILYLSAIENYILEGGQSRGSYMVINPLGETPSDMLPDHFRFLPDDGSRNQMIQEIWMENGEIKISWRAVRPLPETDTWFETVWKDYKNNAIFHTSEV